MAWKQTGQPTVQQQRSRWVVRVSGIDTETGRRRPRQLGSYTTRRSAQAAATSFAAGPDAVPDRHTVGHVVDRWVASKIDVSSKTKMQYEWAAGHIRSGLGGVRLDQLERHDVARWLEALAKEGRFSRRSIQIMRTVLRAALEDAVDLGELRRSPATRVGMPRYVAGRSRQPGPVAWSEDELRTFLAASADHRWYGRSGCRPSTGCGAASCSA